MSHVPLNLSSLGRPSVVTKEHKHLSSRMNIATFFLYSILTLTRCQEKSLGFVVRSVADEIWTVSQTIEIVCWSNPGPACPWLPPNSGLHISIGKTKGGATDATCSYLTGTHPRSGREQAVEACVCGQAREVAEEGRLQKDPGWSSFRPL